MQFDGDRDIVLPPEHVWPKISDAAFLAGCLDGVEVVRAEADAAAWKARPGLSFAAGTLDITLTIVERQPPTRMRTMLFSKGVGASSTVACELTLESRDAGTRVRWFAEITELTGLLKVVPKGLIQSSARKVIDEVWQQVAAKFARDPGGSTP